ARGVEEEDHEGQVVVELEQVQVFGVNAGQPDADEPVGEVFEAFQTDNLPVKLAAVRSGDAADDHHERLAGLQGLGPALLKTGEPAVTGGGLLAAPRSTPARLGHARGIDDGN